MPPVVTICRWQSGKRGGLAQSGLAVGWVALTTENIFGAALTKTARTIPFWRVPPYILTRLSALSAVGIVVAVSYPSGPSA